MSDDDRWLTEVYDDYDRWKTWDGSAINPHERRLMAVELKRSGVTAPARVLEIGFGHGDFLVFLAEQGFNCDGVERRDSHNERLRAHGINATTDDLKNLAAESYDLIVAFDVLEHLDKGQLLDMLRHIERLLKPGGRLLARFPNGGSPFGLIVQAGDLTHLIALSPSSFGQACSVAGLEHVASWNAAHSWRGRGLVQSLVKPFILLLRKLHSAFLAYVHYGHGAPMDPVIVVLARKVSGNAGNASGA